jgi:hypothetical protein
MNELRAIFQSTSSTTAPYNPRANGLTERMNQTLGRMLCSYCYKNQDQWDNYLQFVVYCYNTVVQTSVKKTPFELLFARKPRFPIDEMVQANPPSRYLGDFDNYTNDVKNQMRNAWQAARENIATAQAQQMRFHKAKDLEVKPGDLVLVRYKQFPGNQSRKLARKFHGPYLVHSVEYPNAIVSVNKRLLKINAGNLKVFHPRSNQKISNASQFGLESEDESDSDPLPAVSPAQTVPLASRASQGSVVTRGSGTGLRSGSRVPVAPTRGHKDLSAPPGANRPFLRRREK